MIFTVPIEVLPPSTVVGFKVTETSRLSTTVNIALWVFPNVAEIVA